MVSTLSKITKRLDLAKEQLGVIPAAKGLVFGAIEIDNDICDIQEAHIDQYLADSATIALQCSKVLIVEKHCNLPQPLNERALQFQPSLII